MSYREFLEAKVAVAPSYGETVSPAVFSSVLLPHQRAIAQWMVDGGRRACFAAFGLGKSVIQLEVVRVSREREGGMGLIVIPLGVRQEFVRDARMLGTTIKFIRRIEEAEDPNGIYLTNYETVRDGKLDPRKFSVTSLDEAAVLRGFGGTKTFREFMAKFAGDDRKAGVRTEGIRYRFVATATPSPNEYIELLAYAAFLGVMDVGQAKTRWFKRNSEKADQLTLLPHKEEEFWLWVASWAMFLQRPSDLGPEYSDDGYTLPPLDVRWHMVPTDHSKAGIVDGQGRLFRSTAIGVQDAAREKRDSLQARVAKLMEIRAENPGAHRLLWHDLEDERRALEAAIPGLITVYGSQGLEEREARVIAFSDGEIPELASKPVLLGSGCNFQRHCAHAIFMGISFKFADFIQAVHRIQRFLQPHPVRIDLIYTEAEQDVKARLERKWRQHEEMVEKMTEIIREYGLAQASIAHQLARSLGVDRVEASGDTYRVVNNDCVEETRVMPADSVDLIVTSIPFAHQYEYTPSYNDFGHTDTNAHFWAQMDYLTPELLRVLQPGRVAAVHVKDRITPGGINGLGFQTVNPFSDECVAHFRKHGFAFLARKTIVTDVVRENNQTYRLGWTEQCKDGSRMGAGMPEYLLVFRKPPSDRSNGYADRPVVKSKTEFTRPRWQFDAHGFTRSSGDRPLQPEELEGLTHAEIFQKFKRHSLESVYDFRQDVRIAERVEKQGWLPSTFMLLQPQSWHPDVWADVVRMRSLNTLQGSSGREQHLCLARDSLVLTRAGHKPIQDVELGDEVLTHKGRWRPVIAKRNTGVQPVVRVKAQGVPGLVLTPDHKLWTRRVRDIPWARAHSRRDAQKASPDWLRADETKGHYVNLKLPAVEPSYLSAREWWLVGRWLADGHVGVRGDFWVSIGHHKLAEFEELAAEYAGTRGGETATQIRLKGLSISLLTTLERCGKGAANKTLPGEAVSLAPDLARALLSGYLSGDGHYVAQRNRWMATSVSRELLMGMALLAQRAHGTIATIHAGREAGSTTIEGREVRTQQEWVLSFDMPDPNRKNGLPFILDDGAWKRVRSVEDAGEAETWNLRVAEDESYTAEGCIVKNCPLPFDIVERAIEQYSMPGETVYDPFAGIGTVPYMAIKSGRHGIGVELNPTYFLDAAAYCAAAEREISMPTLFDLIDSEPAGAAETEVSSA